MTEDVRLEPCPFCGSKRVLAVPTGRHYAMCMACGARGADSSTKDDAIAAWNRRASLSRGLGERERVALREAIAQIICPEPWEVRDPAFWRRNGPPQDIATENALAKADEIIGLVGLASPPPPTAPSEGEGP